MKPAVQKLLERLRLHKEVADLVGTDVSAVEQLDTVGVCSMIRSAVADLRE